MSPLLGVLLVFAGHAVAMGLGAFFTRNLPFNGEVPVAGLLGLIQLVYVLPGLALFWRRRRPVAYGIGGAALLTAAMSFVGLSL